MSKSKKLTFNMVAAMMEEPQEVKIKLNDETEITIRKHLTAREAMEFIENVYSSCIDENEGKYTPEAYDIALGVNTLVYYAGFEQPKDVSKAYSVIYGTYIRDKVLDIVNNTEYLAIISAIDKKINNAREMFNAGATAAVNELIGKMDEMIESGNEVMQYAQSGELLKAVNSIAEVNRGTADGLIATAEDVAEDARTIGDATQKPRGTVIPMARPVE